MRFAPRGRFTATTLSLAVAGAALVATTGAPAEAAPPTGPPSLSGGVNGQVYATAVVGDTVYVGGSFTAAQTESGSHVSRTNLAAFSLSTGKLLTSWRADTDNLVRSLASDGHELYVGGQFTTIKGVAQARLAAVDLDTGDVDTAFAPTLSAGVRALQVTGGGVYAGGGFTHANGTARTYLAEFDANNGDLVPGFTAEADNAVDSLALSPDNGRLAVGGAFKTLAGSSRPYLGVLDAQTGAVVAPAFPGTINPMLAVAWNDGGTALFAGSGNSANMLGRWNPTTGARGWHLRVGGDVQAVGFRDSTVYVGFHDRYQGDKTTKMLAINAGTGAVSTAFRPKFDRFWGVRSISAGPWGLVVGGQFTQVSGVWAHGWAVWPAQSKPSLQVTVPARAVYGAKTRVDVTLPADASGQVTLTGAGAKKVATVSTGAASFVLPRGLSVGKHTLKVSYSGDRLYTSRSAKSDLRVTKAPTTVHAKVSRKPTKSHAGRVKVHVVSTPHPKAAQKPRGSVRLVLVKGSKHHKVGPRALRRGVVTLTVPKLGSGSWRLVVKYHGDASHKSGKLVRTLVVR